MMTRAFVIACAALAIGTTACVVDSHDNQRTDVGPSSGGGGGSAGTGGSTTPSAQPMLVVVDADKTMNAAPGDGVGVFVEYATGGHWHLWWTCDTTKTGQSCAFDVSAHVESGALSNVQFGNAPDGTNGGSDVHATSTLTNDMSTVDFDTDPGATITVTATVGGLTDPAFFFFVQNGQVNGGYDGHLTNPLRFQPNKP